MSQTLPTSQLSTFQPADAQDDRPPAKPRDRRPIHGAFRATAHATVELALRHGISANAISASSLVAAAGAAACFLGAMWSPWLLVAGAVLVGLRLWLNMLDGMVALAAARATGTVPSPRGELWNDLPDRFADVLILVGVAHSGLCHVLGGYQAALAALLVAYVGISGQAVGAGRPYGGVMAKPWRMLVVILAALATFATAKLDPLSTTLLAPPRFAGWTPFDLANAVIVAGAVQTIASRLRHVLHRLPS